MRRPLFTHLAPLFASCNSPRLVRRRGARCLSDAAHVAGFHESGGQVYTVVITRAAVGWSGYYCRDADAARSPGRTSDD